MAVYIELYHVAHFLTVPHLDGQLLEISRLIILYLYISTADSNSSINHVCANKEILPL